MGRRNKMTKRISAVLLTVVMLASLLVGVPAGEMRVVEAATTEDGFEYSILDDGTVEIIGYLGEETELVIPDKIEGKSVTSIGAEAFMSSTLISVEIPNSVTIIGESAFSHCENLYTVKMSDSVDYIANSTFWACYNLSEIEIPSGVTFIDYGAFYDCESLMSINIPDSVTSIGERAFEGCVALTNINIPDNVKTIKDSAFSYCAGLTSINIPQSVTEIEGGAFSYCENIVSIVVDEKNPIYNSKNECNAIIETATDTLVMGCSTTKIPNDVTSIGTAAFNGCWNMQSIEIPDSVIHIEVWAFRSCLGLTSIEIPSSVTNIGEAAFFNCVGLTDVRIPNGVKSLGDSAFKYCENLVSIEIPNSVTEIGYDALAYCSDSLIVYANRGSVAATYAIEEGFILKSINNDEIIDGSDIVIDDTITTDDLFKDHPEALRNQAYDKTISMLFEDCAEAVDIYNSDIAKQLWSSFKYGLTDGPEVLVKSVYGGIFGDNVLYREFIDEEVEDLMASVSGNDLLLNEAVDNVNKEFDTYKLIKDIAGNTYGAAQKEKIVKALASTKYYNEDAAKELCEAVEKDFDDIDEVFEGIDVTISVADAIITVAQICSIKIEMVDTVMESIPKDTDLYKSLGRLRNRITSDEALARMIGEEKIFDEIASFVEDAAVYGGIRSFSDIALKEAAPAMFFGKLVVDTWAKLLPEASADDLVKANLNNGIFTLLSGAVNAKYVELFMLKQQGAPEAQIEQAKKEYKILYIAHIEALKNAIETAETLTEPSSIEKFYDFFGVTVVLNPTIKRYHGYLERNKELVELVTYDGYINSCLYQYVRKHETQYLYEVKDGKATIIGCSINGAKNVNIDKVSVNRASASSNDGAPVMNVTNVRSSATLGISENASTSYNTIIMLPDAVGDVPVTAVDSEAFAGGIANAVVVFPDSIKTVAEDSFDSNSHVLLIGKSEQGIEACATATNNTAHVIEKSVESIEIVSLPNKLTYEGVESLDEQGMTLKVTYSDGTESEITKGWFSYIDQRQLGANTVTVEYADCTTFYDVTVETGEVGFTVYFRDEYGNDLIEKDEYVCEFGDYLTVYAAEIPYYTPLENEVSFLLDEYKEIVIEYTANETINIENAKVTPIKAQEYTGKEITPSVEVSLNGKTLTENVDYELEYFSNVDEGTAEIIIWGIGLYSGEVITSFQIQEGKCKVVLEYDNGQANLELEVKKGEKIQEPQIPTKDGYEFDGWYYKDNASVKYDFATSVSKDIVLIAKWIPIGKVGTKVTSGINRYIITSDSDNCREVSWNGVTSKKKTIKIPAEIKVDGVKYKVTSIEDNACKGNKKVTKITIGKNVKTIGENAFNGCTKLKKLSLGSSIETIKSKAFYKCTSLTEVTLPKKVSKIEKQAFYGCKKLKSIKIMSSKLKTVGKNAIKGIHKKATIKVPKKKLTKYKKLFKTKTGYKKSMKIKKN